MEIVLARHGRPKLDRRAWVTPRQMADCIHLYNSSDILTSEVPSEARKKAEGCGVIASSTLRRSVQSAQRVAPYRAILTEQVFCEAGLPYSEWGFPPLPLPVWFLIFRVAWSWGYSSNAEPLSAASARARTAAARLTELAQQHQSVFLVGHGIMTMLIARQLLLLGWRGPKRPANGYWRYSVYHFP